MYLWSEVADNYYEGTIISLTDEGNHAVVIIVAVDPLETAPIEINLPEGLVFLVELVQVARVFQHLSMHVILLNQMPVKALILVPLNELTKLTAHE